MTDPGALVLHPCCGECRHPYVCPALKECGWPTESWPKPSWAVGIDNGTVDSWDLVEGETS